MSLTSALDTHFGDEWGGLLSWIKLDQPNIEPFDLTDKPQVFVAIHSPYVPIDFEETHAIRQGIKYEIDVQLARERGAPAASSLPDGVQGQRTLGGRGRVHQPQLLSGNSFSSRSFKTECGSYIVPKMKTICRDTPLQF
ncbi:hypothetical protein AVEN_264270-1 [Araneus ventricosus]|uniref:Uncharacterized protein n=1 Tax=Araneus ventricosus TaxID=182803 RepID=A0A4Y2QYI0_ARAVE|nr:hypothetical protein AVEN_264270-1 [Araneus ventricosus]